jgi:pilus assembly protein CpaF
MNTGHDGSLTTLHANSPSEVVTRLVMMARYGMDLPVDVIEEQVASALDLIVQLDRFADGTRRITSICECGGGRGGVTLERLVEWDRRDGSYTWNAEPQWLDDPGFREMVTEGEVESWRSSLGSSCQ